MARRIAVKNGLRYAYTGNVHDEEGGSTYCHQCGSKLIGRDWYVMTAWNLTDDCRCKSCGTAWAGVFGGPARRWGAERIPVRAEDFTERGTSSTVWPAPWPPLAQALGDGR